jgi:hypothetical protein
VSDYHASLHSRDSGGVLYVNTLAVHSDHGDLGIEVPSLQEVATGIHAWLHGPYRAILSNRYTWDDISVRNIPDDGNEAVHAVGELGQAPAGDGKMPKELVVVVSLKTSQATRSGRGNMRLPSPCNSTYLADPSNWDVASLYWTDVKAFCAALEAGHDFNFGPGGLEQAHLSARVWSRVRATTYDVTAALPRSYIRWLNSRQTAP